MVVGAIVVIAVVAGAAPATAHPLGNFTTNRYARVEVSAGVLRVYYVLDEAELRAFERRDALKRDRAGFIAQQVDGIRAGLRVSVADGPLDLVPAPARLDLLPGQAGLDTLRLAVVFSAPIPQAGGDLEGRFEDLNEPDRLGWREIVVVGRGDTVVGASSVPSRDTSDELRDYPEDRLQAPLDQRSATFSFAPGTRTAEVLELRPPAAAATRAGGKLTALIERQDLTVPVVAGLLGLAFLFGSAHALGPGHGKTVMAAYLVGTRGRTVDAVLLGLIVSLMHTGSVLLLGLVLLQLDRFGAIERIYPILTVLSGVAVAGFAAALLRSRVATLRASGRKGHVHHDHHDHDHHDHHGDQHGHGGGGHQHGPGGHSHDLAEGTAPLSRRGLVLLATSGGLLPSPSAVLVVVAGFAAGRVALGLSIVLAFSVGLAATLAAVGVALVLGRKVIEGRGGAGVVRVLPVGGAIALLVVGLVLFGTGLAELR
jgi:nickel/cobalt exporter